MHFIDQFCRWLEETSLSLIIQKTFWIVPAVQTVHILAIATVLASVLMIDLRLIGLGAVDQSPQRVFARFLPVIWWTLPILLLTGIIMIMGEPARSLRNPVFQLKMVLLLAAIAVTAFLGARLGRADDAAEYPRSAKFSLVALSMFLWIGIVFAGRWIAYF